MRAFEVFRWTAGCIFKCKTAKIKLAKNIKNGLLFCNVIFYQISFWKFLMFCFKHNLLVHFKARPIQTGYFCYCEIHQYWCILKFKIIASIKRYTSRKSSFSKSLLFFISMPGNSCLQTFVFMLILSHTLTHTIYAVLWLSIFGSVIPEMWYLIPEDCWMGSVAPCFMAC